MTVVTVGEYATLEHTNNCLTLFKGEMMLSIVSWAGVYLWWKKALDAVNMENGLCGSVPK